MEVEQENFNVECDLQSPKSCSDFGEDVGEDSQEKINGGGNQQNHMEEDPESPMVEPEVSLDVSRVRKPFFKYPYLLLRMKKIKKSSKKNSKK